ncbi:MAG TPA: radical SAM family heme chaperone HemW [Terracidiphilus sp.]|nr:radical SAM family heme chaperone HemW [Terracidiphilus sp.]
MVSVRDNALGIYISVPFCRSKCTYCNFVSGVYPAGEHARYVARLIEDLRGAGDWAARVGVELPRQVDTIYFGGGTPSLLEPGLLAKLFAAIGDVFNLDREAEITVECAPGQLPDGVLEALASAGVNRVSLGVQSFVDVEARGSGRLHDRSMVERDIGRIRAAGIENINVDLIAGLAGQTMATWQESVDTLIGCGVPHASVYMLEVDEDSRLGRELLAGGVRYRAGLVPGDDAIAEMYACAIEWLEKAAIGQYEISNFSRPGFESRHNLRYWERRPYLGVGLDASSMLRSGRGGNGYVLRTSTTADLKAYIEATEETEMAWLPPTRQHEEAWFLGLRLNAGVHVANVEREFGRAVVEPAKETARRLASEGLLTWDGTRFRLTARGRLISNEVFQEFLAEANEPLTRA